MLGDALRDGPDWLRESGFIYERGLIAAGARAPEIYSCSDAAHAAVKPAPAPAFGRAIDLPSHF